MVLLTLELAYIGNVTGIMSFVQVFFFVYQMLVDVSSKKNTG